GQYDQNGNSISTIGNIALGDADADPGQVIVDFLTNPTYGAMFPPNFLDTSTLVSSSNAYVSLVGDRSLSTYCQAVGLAWSTILNNSQSAGSVLDQWVTNLGCAIVWNCTVLKFIPYWDAYCNNNPGFDITGAFQIKYFNPYLATTINLPISRILQSTEQDSDPISFSKKDPMAVYNTVRVSYHDRTNYFNSNVVEAKDEVHAGLYGTRVDNISSAGEYTLTAYANVVAQIKLRRNIGITKNFTFKVNPLWGFLDPMDIITIPDPTNWNNSILVRIISMEDDSDDSENITIIAEEFPVGVQSPVIIPVAGTTPPTQGNINLPAVTTATPVIFEPTSTMLTATGYSVTTPQIVIGFAGLLQDQVRIYTHPTMAPFSSSIISTVNEWGGAYIWISLDDINYQKLGTLKGPSTIGQLTKGLLGYSGSNPDNTHTLAVSLSVSTETLSSSTTLAAVAGKSLCIIQDSSGFELLSYTTATLTSTYTYALTGLYRGLYGTTPREFGTGSYFLYLGINANYFETALPPQYNGYTFWLKLQSFNGLNSGVQDLTTCTAYQFTAIGTTPIPPISPTAIQPANYRRITPDSIPQLSHRRTII